MSSYQHSFPGQHLNVDLASADENDPLYSSESRRPATWKNKRVVAITILGVLLMAFVALVSPSHQATALMESDASGPPDYNSKEGQYDWQKCKESNDPDCWKKEGERVGHWWEGFGQKMKSWWSNLFGGGGKGKSEKTTTSTTEEPAAVEEKTTKPKKKKTEEVPAPEPAAAKEPKS
jgi:hypothetical protein